MRLVGDIVKIKYDTKIVEYENFYDLGNYMLELKGSSIKDLDRSLAYFTSHGHDVYKGNACSGSIKKNNKNEVLMSHSMDLEISNRPGYISRISDGKYDTFLLTYKGGSTLYKYTPEELRKMDKDLDYIKELPFSATDVFNEKGLYACVAMRCGDAAGGMDCPGTNPGKTRACVNYAPALVALNCATVKEAVAFLKDSYDWYTLTYVDITNTILTWNMAFLIGDASGEYGLVEFGRNGVFFTPYQNFQSNYYIHPLLCERALENHGHGRAAALLDGLMDVQTEADIMENQKKARYRNQIFNPSWEYFSDVEKLKNINVRRSMSNEMMLKEFDEYFFHIGGIDDHYDKLKAYYAGDETGLREDSMIWLGTITTGVNCVTKHMLLEMWENGTNFEIQW